MKLFAKIVTVLILMIMCITTYSRDYAKDNWIAFYGGRERLPIYPKKLNPGWSITIGKNKPINSIDTINPRRVLKRRSGRAEILIIGKIKMSKNTRLTANLKGENPGGLKPNMRPYLNKDRIGEFNRWWSSKTVFLENDPFVSRIRIHPRLWTSVYGKSGVYSKTARSGFRSALNRSHLGFTFGGGSSYGHGVKSLNGSCEIILKHMIVR